LFLWLFASEPFAVFPSGKNVRGAVYRCWQTYRAVIVPLWTGESQQLFIIVLVSALFCAMVFVHQKSKIERWLFDYRLWSPLFWNETWFFVTGVIILALCSVDVAFVNGHRVFWILFDSVLVANLCLGNAWFRNDVLLPFVYRLSELENT
jgi:hypothetical protein